MRLTQFLILEKITKKELKDVLNNDNVIVGAEFEFIHHDIKDRVEGGDDRQRAYEAAMRDFREWENEMEYWQSEYNEINTQIFYKENDIEDLESEIQDLENNKLDLEEKIRKSYDAEEDEETRQEIEDIQKQIDEKSEEVEKLEDEKKDYESDLEMHEMDGMPRPGIDYLQYIENYHGENISNVDATDLPEPVEVDEAEIDEESWKDIAEEELPNSIRDAMFLDNYEIGGYGDIAQFKGDDIWAFEYDSSVSPYGGVEMKSPPLKLPDFMDRLPDMLNWISDVGTTDNHCGLHFHMSLDNITNLEGNLDMVKLILFSEEEQIYKFFPNRIDNHYAQEVKNKVVSSTPSQVQKYVKQLFGKKSITPEDASDLLGGHYDAIHKVADSRNPSHVEFRHPGGNNYHKKQKEIRTLLGKYATTLSIACDPEYKYKEYVGKLVRIINKIEKVTLKQVYEAFEFLVEEIEKKTNSEVLKRAFEDGSFKVTEDNYKLLIQTVKRRMRDLKQQISNLNVKVSNKENHIISTKVNVSKAVAEEKQNIIEKVKKRS